MYFEIVRQQSLVDAQEVQMHQLLNTTERGDSVIVRLQTRV
jgi:hypothetical protein